MKIVQVVETLEPGGAERVVVDLSNELAARHEMSVICTLRAGELASQLDRAIRLVVLAGHAGNDLRRPFRLARELRRAAADAVHCHHWGAFLDCALAGVLARVPVMVHTAHGLYPPVPAGRWSAIKRALRHRAERLATYYCRRIVVVTDALIEDAQARVGIPARYLCTIQNGIRVDGATSMPHPASDAFTFICVARLAAVKNLPMLIRAFALACRQRPRLRLTITGDGPLRAELEAAAAASGAGERIAFTGFQADVAGMLGQADAFVLPSLAEGMPVSVLEAMRARLPIIATRVGGLPDMVADGVTGLLVDSDKDAALAAAMVRLAGAPDEARAMGEAGYRRLQARYGIAAMVSSYERLYRATG